MISVVAVIAGDVIVKEGDLEVEDNLKVGEAILNFSNTTTGGVEKDYLSLDGDGDYVDCGNDASLNITNEITISVWAKHQMSLESGVAGLVVKDDPSAGEGYGFYISSAETFKTQMRIGVDWEVAEDTIARNDNQWHHVVVTYNSSTLILYVDGGNQDEELASGSIDSNSYNLKIGSTENNKYFSGIIDDVMIFNRTLNSTEIADLNNSGRNLGSYSDANLVSHWRFDDGTADDDKGRNNGTLQGDASVEQSTGGTTTEVLAIDSNLGVLGNITADSYLDHTPAWSKSEDDALEAVLDIKSKDGEIEHSSLPDIAKTKTGRSLGGMITVLVEAVKGVFNRIEDLEQENQMFRDELCKKDDSYSWC